ncbi:tRNA (adenosine(37)-N6)-threonylcarbamoyltransferase complex dimerization subunit type 1 TsaB [Candidatus Xianfuyuplasma coldseepsis]|uniref:tRNA (Adenosine(37)-N6)-threonylcarbamoyltransferase complex dimerization subunit type 1 TsaB n=1 Tax=Candidatus Xianfuyuplasma coldseepsis TaxID=2782163 RepID=A0A7L7KR54_9MOLU|nr:tRNA (adenosine(37)-N6)-threonylcarbamoyltransferase complex dimerization subunit type 1 TsaB [Xianfuyuplasma coldseepsis]QMS84899.1 tRNA (adenosine(37)-N6)-threonylcarbamoyltransferase complex dimerization subunit type 1 TsaB [Xianfuyuplasma coldseepsis]
MKQLLKRLAIDTATKYLFIGLYEDDTCLTSYYKPGDNDHSVKLMSMIETMFDEVGWSIADLDEIIIGIGPGSYTGLRIGVVVAKMFAWNNSIPVKTVSSLALVASSYVGSKYVLVEFDARRGNSFLGLYKRTGKSLELVDNEQLTNLVDYKKSLDVPFDTISNGEPNMSVLLTSDLFDEVIDIHGLNPNYLRKTEAERNLENS